MNNNITLDFSLFDGFPDMCFLVNENGNIRVLNKASINRLGLHTSEPEIFFDYVELCDRSKAESLFKESFTNGNSSEFETVGNSDGKGFHGDGEIRKGEVETERVRQREQGRRDGQVRQQRFPRPQSHLCQRDRRHLQTAGHR